jgi:hypothetical protein
MRIMIRVLARRSRSVRLQLGSNVPANTGDKIIGRSGLGVVGRREAGAGAGAGVSIVMCSTHCRVVCLGTTDTAQQVIANQNMSKDHYKNNSTAQQG